MKEKSYAELMKANAMKRQRNKEFYVLDLYIDMMLLEIHLKAEKEILLKEIDLAIDSRNKERFIQLTKQYNDLQKRFGT